MPTYKAKNSATGEEFTFNWNKDSDPTPEDIENIALQRARAKAKIAEIQEDVPYWQKLALDPYGTVKKTVSELPVIRRIPGVKDVVGAAAGALASTPELGNLPGVRSIIPPDPIEQIRQGLIKVSSLREAPESTWSPARRILTTPIPESEMAAPYWRRAIGGATDIAQGALTLAAPSMIGQLGLPRFLTGLGSFTAGDLGAQGLMNLADKKGVIPPEVRGLVGMAAGGALAGGVTRAMRPRVAPTPTPKLLPAPSEPIITPPPEPAPTPPIEESGFIPTTPSDLPPPRVVPPSATDIFAPPPVPAQNIPTMTGEEYLPPLYTGPMRRAPQYVVPPTTTDVEAPIPYKPAPKDWERPGSFIVPPTVSETGAPIPEQPLPFGFYSTKSGGIPVIPPSPDALPPVVAPPEAAPKMEPLKVEPPKTVEIAPAETEAARVSSLNEPIPVQAGDVYKSRLGTYEITRADENTVEYKFTGSSGKTITNSMPRVQAERILKSAQKVSVEPTTPPKVESPPIEPQGKEFPLQRAARRLDELLTLREATQGKLSSKDQMELEELEKKFERLRRQRGSIGGGGIISRVQERLKSAEKRNAAEEDVVHYLRRKKAAGLPFEGWEKEAYTRLAPKVDVLEETTRGLKGKAGRFQQLFGSIDQFLEKNEWTAPISDIIHKAKAEGDMWYVKYMDKFNEASRGAGLSSATITTKTAKQLAAYLRGEPGNYSPKVQQIGQRFRAVFDELLVDLQQRGVTDSQGNPIQRLEDYLPEIARDPTLPEELRDLFHEGTLRGVFKHIIGKPEKISIGEEEKGGIYTQRKNLRTFRFAEKRTGQEQRDLEDNPFRLARTYLELARHAAFDRPAIKQANALLEKLPESEHKNAAEYYIKNYANLNDPDIIKMFKDIDRKWARTGAQSVLFGSTKLQVLHTGRVLTQVYPELGFKPTMLGLAKTMLNPRQAFQEVRRVGLLPQSETPLRFKKQQLRGGPDEIISWMGNFADAGNAFAKSVAYHGVKSQHPDWPEWVVTREVKRIEGVPGRESPIVVLDYTPRFLNQFKYWLFKYGENFARATAQAILKSDPKAPREMAKFGRYLLGGLAAYELTKETGVTLWHLRGRSLFEMSGITGSLFKEIGQKLAQGDIEGAMTAYAKYKIPGGQSIPQEIEKGGTAVEDHQ